MALIVETGSGSATAESYATVAEASAYHAVRGNEDAWDAIDDQEAALRLATMYMEQAYRLKWKSHRVSSTQALSWPRAYVQTPDAPYGYGSFAAYVPNNVVPTEVKHACMELALKTADGALAPDIERSALIEKIGAIEVHYDPNAPQFTRYRSIDMLLAPYFNNAGVGVSLVRS